MKADEITSEPQGTISTSNDGDDAVDTQSHWILLKENTVTRDNSDGVWFHDDRAKQLLEPKKPVAVLGRG